METKRSVLLNGLNTEQQQAVLHRMGPMLVLAGAGTGKTSVLTHRIAMLIENGVDPKEILALTFTRKAAVEMSERVLQLVDEAAEGIRIGTFHSLALEIVRTYGHVVGLSRSISIGVDVTFDMLLILAAEILSLSELAKSELRKRFRFILVDEYQDTNEVQFKILQMLLTKEANLFVVGDDDQSIYSFQGASIELIRSFEEYFPAVKLLTLQRNYRCANSIVRLANRVIANISDRFDKHLTACRDIEGTVQYSRLNSCLNERRFILNSILRFCESGFRCPDMAILVRSHNIGNYIGEFLKFNGIKIGGENGVNILTLHSSKGLEFPIVFIPALEEGRLPHFASVEAARTAIEEERRLFYVGITRARDHLVLSCAMKRNERTQRSSQFLRQIPPPPSKFRLITQARFSSMTLLCSRNSQPFHTSHDLSKVESPAFATTVLIGRDLIS